MLFFSLDVTKELFDLFIIKCCEIHNIFESFVKIGLDLHVLLSTFDDQVVDPVLKVKINTTHMFIKPI